MSQSLEYREFEDGTDCKTIEARLAGHPVTFYRYKDWLTTAVWNLPGCYSFSDFLRVVEEAFQQAENNGYEPDGLPQMAVASRHFGAEQMQPDLTFTRPLETSDFEDLGISADQVDFIRLGDDLAHFTFERDGNRVGLIFYEKPHQTRSAFHFMAELLPASPNLDAKRIGDFVLDLPR